jgi:6,7-dimethyl-8-ribityllumazine synthase
MSQKPLTISNLNGSKTKVAIIYTIFNEDLVMPLLINTTETLINLKVLKKNISTYQYLSYGASFACNKIV